jgi:hypothetical protein
VLNNKIEGGNSDRAFFSELPNVKIESLEILAINGVKIPTHNMEGLDESFWINNYHK